MSNKKLLKKIQGKRQMIAAGSDGIEFSDEPETVISRNNSNSGLILLVNKILVPLHIEFRSIE